MRSIFTFIFIFTAAYIQAQDLTGVWQGHFRTNNLSSRPGAQDDRYKFEVQIALHGKRFEAVTYSYQSAVFYGKAAANGSINPRTGKVILQEGKLLEVRNLFGETCTMTCFLQYSRSGDEEFLEGSFVSMNIRDSSNCGKGTLFLRKVISSDFYKEPFLAKKEKEREDSANATKKAPKSTAPVTVKKPVPTGARVPDKASNLPAHKTTPAHKTSSEAQTKIQQPPPPATKPNLARTARPQALQPIHTPTDTFSAIGKKFQVIAPKVLTSRSTELVRTLVLTSNEVELNIYDDGAIDHDTVSVYLDNKQVVGHAMLTDRPITLTLHMDDTLNYHELVLVAENEGEIPPNTSLMVVKAGEQRFEVRITSTEQKNAKVIFQFRKDK
ncbi:hypothetical protein ACX0G9_28115 [Flavitalea flava]